MVLYNKQPSHTENEWQKVVLSPCLVAVVQGFQCLVDDHSGFGQFAADVVAELGEDYSTAPVLVSPVRPTHAAPSQAQVWPQPPSIPVTLIVSVDTGILKRPRYIN